MQNISQLLAKPAFKAILLKINSIQRLNESLHEALTAEFSQHCQVASMEDNCLLLHVDNSAWATRLRYETPQLIQTLTRHPDFKELKSIRWQVQQPSQAKPTTPKRLDLAENHPHAQAINTLLIRTSQDINNKKLKTALARLAEQFF